MPVFNLQAQSSDYTPSEPGKGGMAVSWPGGVGAKVPFPVTGGGGLSVKHSAHRVMNTTRRRLMKRLSEISRRRTLTLSRKRPQTVRQMKSLARSLRAAGRDSKVAAAAAKAAASKKLKANMKNVERLLGSMGVKNSRSGSSRSGSSRSGSSNNDI
jgi:hypothetical protein